MNITDQSVIFALSRARIDGDKSKIDRLEKYIKDRNIELTTEQKENFTISLTQKEVQILSNLLLDNINNFHNDSIVLDSIYRKIV